MSKNRARMMSINQGAPTMALDSAGFPEIQVESLRDKVVAMLKDAFFSGALKPGDLIVERHLAREMKIGTPAVREALISLQEQGFVRRVANTATYVTKYTVEEIRQLYSLRIEFETLALQWAKPRVTRGDIRALEKIIERMTGAASKTKTRAFYEYDLEFHRLCWNLSGNKFLAHSLETLVTPLFAFVLSGGEDNVRESVAHEHIKLVSALRDLQEPEFSSVIRNTLDGFALNGIASMIKREK